MKNIIRLDSGLELREKLSKYGHGDLQAYIEDVEVGVLQFVVFEEENKIKIQWIKSHREGLKIGSHMINCLKIMGREKGLDEIVGSIKTGSQVFYEKIGAIIGDAGQIFEDESLKGQPAFRIKLKSSMEG